MTDMPTVERDIVGIDLYRTFCFLADYFKRVLEIGNTVPVVGINILPSVRCFVCFYVIARPRIKAVNLSSGNSESIVSRGGDIVFAVPGSDSHIRTALRLSERRFADFQSFSLLKADTFRFVILECVIADFLDRSRNDECIFVGRAGKRSVFKGALRNFLNTREVDIVDFVIFECRYVCFTYFLYTVPERQIIDLGVLERTHNLVSPYQITDNSVFEYIFIKRFNII